MQGIRISECGWSAFGRNSRINTLIWQSIEEDLPSFREARGAILAAVEAFLTSPVCLEQISIEEVSQIWQKSHIIDAICHRYLMGLTPRKDEVKSGDIASIKMLTGELCGHVARVNAGIEISLSLLRPL